MNGTAVNDNWNGISIVPWYLAGGVPQANAVAVYQAVGAASVTDAKTNIANPGVNTLYGSSGPTWDAVNGWYFDGGRILYSGLNPATHYSAVLKYTSGISGPLMSYSSVPRFTIGYGNVGYGDMSVAPATPAMSAAGVIALTDTAYYVDGTATAWTPTWSGSITQGTGIGGSVNSSGVISGFGRAYVAAVAYYDITLSATQAQAITSAAALLNRTAVAGVTPTALATGEKIFSGGYKFTSTAANLGMYNTFSATLNGNYVLRAIGNSDGTCAPKIQVTRADGSTVISSLTGTTTSTRTAPDVYVFTWQSPAAESEQIQLINTAATGTCYWHQVEVQANNITNPSLEVGAGNPWIPTGWSNNNLVAGEGIQEVANMHSGSSGVQVLTAGYNKGIKFSYSSVTQGKYYSVGVFGKKVAGTISPITHFEPWFPRQTMGGVDGGNLNTISSTAWSLYPSTHRADQNFAYLDVQSWGGTGSGFQYYIDDFYSFALTAVTLTLTPASLANSTEASGVRVDGKDTLTQSVYNLTTSAGEISFNYTPRHSAANMLNFGGTTSLDAAIVTIFGDSNNYILAYWGANNIVQFHHRGNGTRITTTWDATGAIVAGTTYAITINYNSLQDVLKVNGVTKASLSSPTALTTVPATIYYGTDQLGQYQGDAAFAAAP